MSSLQKMYVMPQNQKVVNLRAPELDAVTKKYIDDLARGIKCLHVDLNEPGEVGTIVFDQSRNQIFISDGTHWVAFSGDLLEDLDPLEIAMRRAQNEYLVEAIQKCAVVVSVTMMEHENLTRYGFPCWF